MNKILNFIIENIEFSTAICGGLIALIQWKESNNNRRAKYLDTLLTKLWKNTDIQSFILMNDYDKDWYNIDFHRSDDKTIPTLADKTLSYMNYICYVLKVKIIHQKEKSLFDYYLSSLALCKDMRCYLFDLYQYSIHNKKPFLFSYFLDVCIKEKLLPKAIKNKKYFYYILLEESNSNQNIPYSLPSEIEYLKKEFSKDLFLRSYSRCEHCKNFKNNACIKGKNIKKYYWLPENQKTKCNTFILNNFKTRKNPFLR